ncbi:MAG: TlpA family protein disulfide reductase [Verrucomicrobia bacterium]|nr:TlpA family protein disulfide reductase [Verrucomicrobiota bacterium]
MNCKCSLVAERISASIVLLAGLAALAWPSLAQENFKLQWLESGVSEKVGGYRPLRVGLTNAQPATLKQAPNALAAPRYGSFQIGPKTAPATIHIVVDDPDGKPGQFFVDGNGDGAFTGEAGLTWTERRFKSPDGKESVTYFSDATVTIPLASGPRRAHLKFYRFDPQGDRPPIIKDAVFYYADYGLTGEVRIADKTLSAVLIDSACAGDFRAAAESPAGAPSIWVDANSNGRTDRGEYVPVTRPFEVEGKWWIVTNLTAEGAFQIAASTKPPESQRPAGPDLSPGQKAPAFAAKLANGKPVKFPDDYKGKVVLLDFWATWCGPCVVEIPNVVKAYEQFHEKGLEILGISLDRAGAEQKLADFTREKNMPWPQVFDGKFWQAEVAVRYGIQSIPHMLLVDGDTGAIIADKDIRGTKLAPAIEKALAGKKK